MNSILIVYNQILAEKLLDLLDEQGIRGFTRWNGVQGRGMHHGDPHMGSHAWPALNGAMLCVAPDEQAQRLLKALKGMGEEAEEHGLRAFVWSVDEVV